MQRWSWASGLNTGTVEVSVAKAKDTILLATSLTDFQEDYYTLLANSHNCRGGHLRPCARNKHGVANELDEPLCNLFQWASLASGCCTPRLLNTVP